MQPSHTPYPIPHTPYRTPYTLSSTLSFSPMPMPTPYGFMHSIHNLGPRQSVATATEWRNLASN
ncbi:hypothetical protein B484DRAFT_58677 [Ochromonadaceae sp. CCMP2298]|nr:hypothetical protein B484DRAFT_58677 [Ochromonadaceae sp. CCMP2298]